MKHLGYILITIAFLGGAFFAVQDRRQVRWSYFTVAITLGIAGVIIVRLNQGRYKHTEAGLDKGLQNLATNLNSLVRNLEELNQNKQNVDVYKLHHLLDERLLDDLADFAEHRKMIIYLHGMTAYAEVMSAFAAGERYINRTWSASVDGYIDEAHTYLDKAFNQFVTTRNKLTKLGVTK